MIDIDGIYRKGMMDGFETYAHWQDGTQYVGTTGTTLKKAKEKVDEAWNWDPPRREFYAVYLLYYKLEENGELDYFRELLEEFLMEKDVEDLIKAIEGGLNEG